MSISKPQSKAASNGTASSTAPRSLLSTKRYRRRRGLFAVFQSGGSALEAIRANKMRSLLTSLGIIIGVAAVIMVVASSESSAAVINQRLSSTLNPNQLVVRSGSTSAISGVRGGQGSRQTLTVVDASALAQIAHVSAVSPVANANGQVVFQNQNWSTSVQGVYANLQQVDNWTLQEGSFFTSGDQDSGNSVAVIGQTVADNLFTPLGIDPIGQQIRIRNVPFTIVGLLASKGSSSSFNDPDDVIYIPFSTAQARLNGGQNAGTIDVIVDNSSNVTTVQNAVEQVMEQQHHITDSSQDDFTIQNQSQILQTVQGTSQSLMVALISVAAISLVVGGIGIMNIMLVSVTERTREIGIRIAIGAHPSDVMTQFLVEALILSALGGIVGILVGVAGSYIVSLVNGNPFALSPLAVLIAFLFSAIVGIVFGYYPARRAARLDPIVALRTE